MSTRLHSILNSMQHAKQKDKITLLTGWLSPNFCHDFRRSCEMNLKHTTFIVGQNFTSSRKDTLTYVHTYSTMDDGFNIEYLHFIKISKLTDNLIHSVTNLQFSTYKLIILVHSLHMYMCPLCPLGVIGVYSE